MPATPPPARREPVDARPRRSARDVRRRTLSQNFLAGPGAVEGFLELVDVGPGDLVVEVGAGRGELTTALAGRCRAVIAHELDEAFAARLLQRAHALPNVEVVAGDFLRTAPPVEPFRLVGNVPFSLTAPIVRWCLEAPALRSATVITQLEYARKRTGWYGRWSLLTVRTWPEHSWELRGRIARERFRPVPRVDAGVLHIERRQVPLLPAGRAAAYRRMVEVGFGGAGGTLAASLSRAYPARGVAAAFRSAGIDRATVVAYVSPAAWLRLFELLEGDRGRAGGVRPPPV